MISPEECPFVSVVVPTRNRADLLADCLASLLSQDYLADQFEIIIVDDGSTDDTPALVRSLQQSSTGRTHYQAQSHQGVNAARNRGIRAARGALICFVDDDVDIPLGWLKALVAAAFRHPQAGCLGGMIRVRFEGRPPRSCPKELERSEGELDYGSSEKPVHQVYGGNLMLRRWAIDRIGPFRTGMSGPCDEIEWQRRLRRDGIEIVYVPSAWLWHRRTEADLRRRLLVTKKFWQGVKYASYMHILGEHLSVAEALWRLCRDALHAVRRRCFGGIMQAAWDIGFLWASLLCRSADPGSEKV